MGNSSYLARVAGRVVGLLWLVAVCAPAAGPAAAPAKPAAPAASAPVVSAPSASAPAAPAAAPQASAPAAAPAAGGAGQAAPPPLNPPVTVKVADGGTVAHRGLYIGLERGYFADEGLEIDRIPTTAATDVIAALVTGELHFASGGPDPIIFNAVQRGIGVRIVIYNIQIGQGDRSSGFVVRQDLIDSGRYRELRDFKGLTIGLPSDGGFQHLFVEKMVGPVGLTLADVETTVMPFADGPPALANKRIDAAFLAEPFITVAQSQGSASLVAPMGDVFPGVPGNVLTISPIFAERQPEAARRFITAYLRGQRDYYRAIQLNEGGRDDIVQILIKYTPIKDPKLYDGLLTSPVDPNAVMDPRILNDVEDYYVKFGTVKEKVDSSQVLDRSYADYALQRLGRLP
ncbi:MAG TPA: ABC transporter substrate-binding protein [Chloroflexota bacterium]|jgi:NitT/TauT family transport system substrate-binding protein